MNGRFATRRTAKSTARDRQPRENRVVRFLVITIGSGALAALIAILIAGIPTVLSHVLPPSSASRIDASALFPAAPIVHKTVDVYDPPPAASVVAPTSNPTGAPTSIPRETESPEPGDP